MGELHTGHSTSQTPLLSKSYMYLVQKMSLTQCVCLINAFELHDVVLAVDGRAVEGTDARNVFERLERRGGSTVLTVQRDDHVRMLALIPGE